jgi:hypothetical protein
MKIQATLVGVISAIAALGISLPAQASTDTRNAYCKYFSNGSTITRAAMPCKISSEVEVLDVTIDWQDGGREVFKNYTNSSFIYTDTRGGEVYKRLGLYDPSGRIEAESDRAYKMENGTIYIWWR